LCAGALAAGVLVSHQPRTAAAAATCGTERWSVKTLSDGLAHRVNFKPKATTVTKLRKLTPTGTYARGKGVERTTFRIHVRLVETKLEDDQDYHLAVADPKHHGRTMIVEFPARNCTTHSLKRKQLRSARRAFATACGQPSSSSFHFRHGTDRGW